MPLPSYVNSRQVVSQVNYDKILPSLAEVPKRWLGILGS